MTEGQQEDPRCTTCAGVLPSAGAICHACDVDAHFVGVPRSAPSVERSVLRAAGQAELGMPAR